MSPDRTLPASPPEDHDLETNAPVDEHPGVGQVLARALLSVVLLTALLSLLAAVCSFLFGDSVIAQADVDSVRWLAEHRTPALDFVATHGSALTDTWTVIGVVVGSAWMTWVSGHRRFTVMIVLATVIELTTFFAVGTLVDRPRPDVTALHSFPTTSSYPSGHTAAAFVVYGSLVAATRSISARPVRKALWLLSTVAALVVGWARVYEGVHHPTDVIAGFILGVGALAAANFATGIHRIFRRGSIDDTADSMLDRA